METLPEGTRIKVTGKHPWKGEVGTITGSPPRKIHHFSKEETYLVGLDNGFNCYAGRGEVKEI